MCITYYLCDHLILMGICLATTQYCYLTVMWYIPYSCLNTLRPRQNCCHFADNTLKCIFLNENVRISIKILLKFVPKDPINNIPALVQIMAWRLPGDKPLFEPMMVRLPTNICITLPQWVKYLAWLSTILLVAHTVVFCGNTGQKCVDNFQMNI